MIKIFSEDTTKQTLLDWGQTNSVDLPIHPATDAAELSITTFPCIVECTDTTVTHIYAEGVEGFMQLSQETIAEMGYLNAKALQQYTDFKLSGAVIKKSEFENLGGYKSNIKLTFMYEFLLRALNNACKIFSMPYRT